MMKLSRLLDGISDITVGCFSDAEITSVSVNSKSTSRASLFVAIVGARSDGHDYVSEAYSRGTRVFVVSRKVDLPNDTVIVFSKNTRKTLAELCAKISGNPERRLVFVGVTGTKGKTTTAYLLSKILDYHGVKNILISTLGISGEVRRKTENTTPDPTVLFHAFARASHKGVKVVILEVSSQAVKNLRIYGINFDYLAFTGLSSDHVGEFEHPTKSDYIMSKRGLFTSYGAKFAVVNYDNSYSAYISAGVAKVIKCGFSVGADYRISDFTDSKLGAVYSVSGVAVRSSLPGKYNAVNTVIALALAREITGCKIRDCALILDTVSVPGRFEVYDVNGCNVIVDYAHNYESVKEVLALARSLYGGKIICVFGSVGGRSFERRGELARAGEKYADFSVITSDNCYYESPISVCSEIYSYFVDKTKAKIITERKEAIKYALSLSAAGDTVMILGRGHENTININGEAIPFSDSEFVKTLGVVK